MRKRFGAWPAFIVAAVALFPALGALAIRAGDDDDDDDDEEAIEFEEHDIYFELNDTDGDLGIHAKLDGEAWKTLAIEGPGDLALLAVSVKGRLRQQGLTELFFESDEPTFDELSPAQFFRRFPEGMYEIEGRTLDGTKMESEDAVNHLMPAPPRFTVNGVLPGSCTDGATLPRIAGPFTIRWDAITTSHPTIGRRGEPIEIARYEAVLEREEPNPLEYAVVVGPDVTELVIPAGLVEAGETIKVEVGAKEASGGNQTFFEGCFVAE